MLHYDISIHLDKIRERFLAELENQYREVELLRAQLDRVADPAQACREIGRICHKIAGTAATLGFPELGQVAGVIDDFVVSTSAKRPKALFEMRDHADHLLVLMSLLRGEHSTNPNSLVLDLPQVEDIENILFEKALAEEERGGREISDNSLGWIT